MGSAVSTAKQQHLVAHQWQPGQSGNMKGRPPGSRNKLAEDFVADLHDAWKRLGVAALETTAMQEPSVFVRVVAAVLPKDIDITITNVNIQRMSTHELEALIRAEITGPADPVEAAEDPEPVLAVGEGK